MNVRDVTYKCRDIGYGIEEGDVLGIWGETDWTGKRELVPVAGSEVLYLFPDEIESDDFAPGYLDGENPYAVVFAAGTLQRTMDARDRDVPRVDKVTCGTCGRSWNDAIITGSTPAPSARCPFEHWHESEEIETRTLEIISTFLADIEQSGDLSALPGDAKETLGRAVSLLETVEQELDEIVNADLREGLNA